MSIICQYCEKNFQNNGCLKNHQRRAKYCLRLQSKIKKDDENSENSENSENESEEDHENKVIKSVKDENNEKKYNEFNEDSDSSIKKEKQKFNFQITDIILNKHSEILENNYNKIFDKIEKFEDYIRNNIDKNNYIILLEKNNQDKTNLLELKENEIIKLKENIEKIRNKNLEKIKNLCKKEIEINENTKYKIKNDHEILFQYSYNDYINSTDLCLFLGNEYLNWRKNKLILKKFKIIADINNIDENLLIINVDNKILMKYQILFLLCELYSDELKFNIEKWFYQVNKNENEEKIENTTEIKVKIIKSIKTGFFSKK